MDRVGQDIRLALRGFRRTPGFVATAVIILALGIGMSVAMFTLFRTVLVRQLPVAARIAAGQLFARMAWWSGAASSASFMAGAEISVCG